MLVQIDGSHHRWLEDRGPQFTLLLAVDDATGCVVSALFCQEETTHDYFLLIEGLVSSWGVPLTLYADRHSVFTPRIDTGQKPSGATQFTRAMAELGVELIFARSPQAKGRVERMAGTLQDRLVTELRLARASTIAAANRVLSDFLPRFNEQFGVPPRDPEGAYRPLDPDIHLDRVLCYKHPRKVARDNTLRYRWHTLQLAPDAHRASYAGVRVEVLEGLNGSLRVLHDGRIIPSREAPPRPGTLRRVASDIKHTPVWHGHPNGARPLVGSGGGASNDEVNLTSGRVGWSTTAARLKPNQRQRAWWMAVHEARLMGVSIRGIARELDMSRNTVRKYLAATDPDMVGTVVRFGPPPSDTMGHHRNGDNR